MEISKISRRSKVLRYYYYPNPSFLCSFLNLSSSKVIESSNSIHKKAYSCNSSSGFFSICKFDSEKVQKNASLKNGSCCKLHSDCLFMSNLIQKRGPFFNSSSGLSSSFHLSNPFSQYLNCNFIQNSSVFSDRRFSSVSSSDVNVDSEVVGVVLDEVGWKRKGKGNGKRKGRRVYSRGIDLAPKKKSDIIEIIRRDDNDMEAKLSLVAKELSVESITEIFQVLNCQKISGLRFFRWVRANNPRLYFSADFCSQIINNCGWLDDYDTMLSVLNEFKSEKICLHESAFWFLPVFRTSQSSLMVEVGRLVSLLNAVGGSCRSSGIFAVIEMFCKLDSFEMAKHVMEITQKKSHYNILVRQRCKKGDLVSDIIREMTEFGCEPTIETYNYLVGSLCKNDKMAEAYSVLGTMQEKGVLPDASTFEIFIHRFCNCGEVDLAKKFLNTMVDKKLEPRLETLTAILKALFRSEQYAEAHNYVIDSSVMYKHPTSKLYSLLASLHLSKGDLSSARRILIEMMDKGNKPDFKVYIKIVEKLEKIGPDHSARDIQNMYSSFLVESNRTTGSGNQ